METKEAKSETTRSKRDIYSLVTERIIEQLEKGVVPWASPVSKRGTPATLTTKREYRGINTFILWTAPYDSRFWITFRQAQKLGGFVRKGEKGFPVVYWHWRSPEEISKLSEKTPNPAPCYPFCSTVFNLEQCEGLPQPEGDTETFTHSPLKEAEAVVRGMPKPPVIKYVHTDQPAYCPASDTLEIPVAHRFKTAEDYYTTLFHELAHATGHESRLNRQASIKHRRFSQEYSFEELVAEMTAAFLCARTGIENQIEQSASYIDGWLEVFRRDKTILIDAASAAQKASDYILGRKYADADAAAESSE